MHITHAVPAHLNQINGLLSQNYSLQLTDDHLGSDTLSLVLLNNEKVVGFVQAALMFNKTEAYIDNFVIHPEHQGKQHSVFLLVELAQQLLKLGVKRAWSVVEEQNHFGFAAAVRNFQLGGVMNPSTYKLFNYYPEGVIAKIGTP